MPDKVSSSRGGLSFSAVLFMVFLVLKLTGAISWSWWWVTAPLWGGCALVVVALLAILLFAASAGALTCVALAVCALFVKDKADK